VIPMLVDIAYFSILGKPLIMYGGIASLLLLLLTAAAPKLSWKGKRLMPYRTHVRLAYVTVALVLFHGLLGLSLYFRMERFLIRCPVSVGAGFW